jgi:hypothetical protein
MNLITTIKSEEELMKTPVTIAMLLILCVMGGCAWSVKPIDISTVQSGVVKGKTTPTEIEAAYGTPYDKGIMKDGTTYYYYLSANPLSGASQDFTFYFDKNGKVAAYASEYPGGNPLLK